ncbi:hypothetical protein B0H14DRAFT_2842278 [Mycena olivaceomarginata]|nr:hypothetical protein B0H14DRAFT_2842278 [Mycena olivaceomarginata]
MAESHLGQRRAPLEDLPLDRFLLTPRAKLSGSSPTKGQIEKSIDSSPIPFRHSHSPFQAAMNPSHRSFQMALHSETPPSSHTRTPKCNLFMSSAEITSSPITSRVAHQSPLGLSTRSPTKHLSRRALTKCRILGDSIAEIPPEYRGTLHIPTMGPTSPLPGIGAFAIDDLPIRTASASPSRTPCDSPGRQSQSIHYPGFDVFVDTSETVGLDASMDEEEEKENVGIPR